MSSPRSSLPSLLLAGLLLMTALPARSASLESNEPLVMRIIFEECLGFIRGGRVPFGGLATRPASVAAIEQLPTSMPDREMAVELLSPATSRVGARTRMAGTASSASPSRPWRPVCRGSSAFPPPAFYDA